MTPELKTRLIPEPSGKSRPVRIGFLGWRRSKDEGVDTTETSRGRRTSHGVRSSRKGFGSTSGGGRGGVARYVREGAHVAPELVEALFVALSRSDDAPPRPADARERRLALGRRQAIELRRDDERLRRGPVAPLGR